jgi:hypothetical protein
VPDSFIFCTSFMQRRRPNRTAARWTKWLEYYEPRLALFGASRLFLIDDATPRRLIPPGIAVVDAEAPLPRELPEGAVMFRFSRRLGRQSIARFPGWWRSFSFSGEVARRYHFTKIIHLESDAFVVSLRLARHLRGLSAGWTALWCRRWNFPEPAIQVVCRDQFRRLNQVWKSPERCWFGEEFAEHRLPFSTVNKDFRGDRYGEYLAEYPRSADYVCQSLTRWIYDNRLQPKPRLKRGAGS